jgi:hypothetical protein
MLVAQDQLPEALGWVERGLGLEKQDWGGHGLDRLRRALLVKLGRADEALQSAWADFVKSPHRYSYQHLSALIPEAERQAWRERVLDVVGRARWPERMELLLILEEPDLLASLVDQTSDPGLEDLSHTLGEPLARWVRPIVARGPRPSFELEACLPGNDPEDWDSDPIQGAIGHWNSGQRVEALRLLEALCRADLRCLDAHAHLGAFHFERRPARALRMLWLNPSDNQGYASSGRRSSRIPAIRRRRIRLKVPARRQQANGKRRTEPKPRAMAETVPPNQVTVSELTRWRCNLCEQVFTAPAPTGVGATLASL